MDPDYEDFYDDPDGNFEAEDFAFGFHIETAPTPLEDE